MAVKFYYFHNVKSLLRFYVKSTTYLVKLLLSRNFCQKCVRRHRERENSTIISWIELFYLRNLTLNWFDEKNFSLFPHCDCVVCVYKKIDFVILSRCWFHVKFLEVNWRDFSKWAHAFRKTLTFAGLHENVTWHFSWTKVWLALLMYLLSYFAIVFL